jgi:predicted nucleic acid-binding protein
MRLYAESSAVLNWLLDEGSANAIRTLLGHAELIVASDLVLIECDRVLIRAGGVGRLSEAEVQTRRAALAASARGWVLLRIDANVVERARRAFPIEPIRTLDAIHLASALAGRRAVPDLELLSLDEGVRSCGSALGFTVVPSALQ